MDHSNFSTTDEKQRVFGSTPQDTSTAGPSSSRTAEAPSIPVPSGPPPSYYYGSAPPPDNNEDWQKPPPLHNWQEAVPDTADLPPPPAHAYLYSNTGNAPEEDAERAHEFCDSTPLTAPFKPSELVHQAAQRGDFQPIKPREYNGSLTTSSPGKWQGRTVDGNKDCILWTNYPIYFATEDSPLQTEVRKTIYFEVKLINLYNGTPTQTSGFSIGYVAHPYPTWRSPGWERGSLGVFSDDGCRFINDSWGGREFTTEFKVGETVGLGMTFYRHGENPFPGSPAGKAERPDGKPHVPVEVFFTRNGKFEGKWELHEEADEEAGGIGGLEGDFDLHGAIGLFGGVEFEVCFDRKGWLWTPPME